MVSTLIGDCPARRMLQDISACKHTQGAWAFAIFRLRSCKGGQVKDADSPSDNRISSSDLWRPRNGGRGISDRIGAGRNGREGAARWRDGPLRVRATHLGRNGGGRSGGGGWRCPKRGPTFR